MLPYEGAKGNLMSLLDTQNSAPNHALQPANFTALAGG